MVDTKPIADVLIKGKNFEFRYRERRKLCGNIDTEENYRKRSCALKEDWNHVEARQEMKSEESREQKIKLGTS